MSLSGLNWMKMTTLLQAGNRISREEYNRILDDENMERDDNTVGFTMFGGEIIRRERPEHL